MSQVFKSVVVETNVLGQCLNVFEIKTLPAERVNELKKQALETRHANEKLAREKLEAEQLQKELESKKQYVRSILLAKITFDSLVDKGTYETTEEFENHFEQFVIGLAEFDKNLAPTSFLTILERVL